jgi:predicted PurR-regulated permease PerM
MMTVNPIISTTSRWFAIALSIAFAMYCVFLLGSIGTARATILAIVCASHPLVAWLEARRLRGRGYPEAADSLVMTATGVQLVLLILVSYASDLAELSTGCPPQ